MSHTDQALSADLSNPAIAIIDTDSDTRGFWKQLQQRQVEVVIRYLAFAQSHKGSPKRIVDNGKPGTADSEASQLLDNGFGLVLVYEWGNGNPRKFLFGLDTEGNILTGGPDTDHTSVAIAEADRDADVAAEQLAQIGHPTAPIYFAIDFDLTHGSGVMKDSDEKPVLYSDRSPVSCDKAVAACRAYFERLKQRFGKSRLGLYGGGWVNDNFSDLVTYHWVAQSPGFTDTANYLCNGPWHLFQQWSWGWFTNGDCSSGLDLDTDIQNPDVTDIGAFGKLGPYLIDPARTDAIFGRRYVATRALPLHTRMDSLSPILNKKFCQNGHAVTVNGIQLRNLSARILADDETWLTVDLDEDGAADGYALKKGNFVTSIRHTPEYSSQSADLEAEANANSPIDG
jgi:hypothetical protein